MKYEQAQCAKRALELLVSNAKAFAAHVYVRVCIRVWVREYVRESTKICRFHAALANDVGQNGVSANEIGQSVR